MPCCRFELGKVPPTIEDVRVFPGTDPGAEDIFLEFDFHWRGDQNISLLLNPTPKFMQSVPGLSTLVNKIFTWTVRLLLDDMLCLAPKGRMIILLSTHVLYTHVHVPHPCHAC